MSLHALIVFAAETAEKEEPDKTPFYIAGGLLAAWGFLIGILGTMRHGDFPNDRSARLLMAISALLVAAAMVAAVATG